MRLWIDDDRKAPTGWDHARTSEEAIRMILENPTYEWISFDHDLGLLPLNEATGSQEKDDVRIVINSLWVYGVDGNFRIDKLPNKISSQSGNREGREWILGTFENISRHLQHVDVVEAPEYPKN